MLYSFGEMSRYQQQPQQQQQQQKQQQRNKIEWMPIPKGVKNCAPGLQYLSAIEILYVHQEVEMIEAWSGNRYETPNKYRIRNSFGQEVYYAAEDTDIGALMFGGHGSRTFHIRIFDSFNIEIIHLYRPYAICSNNVMEVSSPAAGMLFGYVAEQWGCFYSNFFIEDRNKNSIFKINKPQFALCGYNASFDIVNMDGGYIGTIERHYPGYLQQMYTDADTFSVTFPKDLEITLKAILLGACFLIDFMYFEK